MLNEKDHIMITAEREGDPYFVCEYGVNTADISEAAKKCVNKSIVENPVNET